MDFHTHNFYEITHIISGEAEYETFYSGKIKKIKVNKNTILIWDGKVAHRSVDKSGKLNQNIICFGYNFLKTYSLKEQLNNVFKNHNPIIFSNNFNLYNIKNLIKRIYNEFKNKDYGYNEIIFGYITNLLTIVLRNIFDTQEKTVYSDERIKNTLKYIENNYFEKISINECANDCEISVRYFSELFKNITGDTFIEFINKFRLNKAKILLETTNKNIINVAFEVGFENISHFNRLFKKYFKLTPKEYKKNTSK